MNCGPQGLPTDTNLLYHNDGDGTFARRVGRRPASPRSRGRYSMTAAAADFDGDGWIDIYVACDSTASILYRNNHDGTFTDTRRRERRGLQRERHAAGRHGPGRRRLQRRRRCSIC